MGLPLFKTPTAGEVSAKADIAIAVHEDGVPNSLELAEQVARSVNEHFVRQSAMQSELHNAYWSLSRSNTSNQRTQSVSAIQPYSPSIESISSNGDPYAQDEIARQESSQTQNTWRPIAVRPTNTMTGSEYVERRLRDAVGQEVERFAESVHPRARNSPADEDRQTLAEVEAMINAVHLEMTHLVNARMGSMLRPGWATETSSASRAPRWVLPQLAPRQLASSAAAESGARPEMPTTANHTRRRSIGFLRPSPASISQVVPHIDPLSMVTAAESTPIPHHVDRAATPPIRSAAPSPPAIAGHVRGRHSPNSGVWTDC
ncbi:hypothetical protein ONS95_011849 [Cadophora gregata]|uniref:uncharacterized protein n=1 Tax=Cadophora gregata TaxID=51156 RepID=UPI0026DCC021|nr:uncharacterized protein ONS95_011849 [Cadophora gregata]KAK0117509.1 hypothetical protein ONS95_011849 [Cadophora gregata]KAK0122563.1 hypothetical protein ONS96_009605 [Cadophora gregata f. sp. sojae]